MGQRHFKLVILSNVGKVVSRFSWISNCLAGHQNPDVLSPNSRDFCQNLNFVLEGKPKKACIFLGGTQQFSEILIMYRSLQVYLLCPTNQPFTSCRIFFLLMSARIFSLALRNQWTKSWTAWNLELQIGLKNWWDSKNRLVGGFFTNPSWKICASQKWVKIFPKVWGWKFQKICSKPPPSSWHKKATQGRAELGFLFRVLLMEISLNLPKNYLQGGKCSSFKMELYNPYFLAENKGVNWGNWG